MGRRLFAVHAEGAEGATLRDLKLEATREALLVDARECWSRGKVSKLSFVGENVAVPPLAGGAAGREAGADARSRRLARRADCDLP